MPACLSQDSVEYDECRALLARHRDELLADMERHEPRTDRFSPLAFSCNFLSNAAVATVAIALQSDDVRRQASLNALFTSAAADDGTAKAAADLAEALMAYSASEPERLGWRGAPLIVHDKHDAVHWHTQVRRTL
jgi:hypothetical protein